MNAIAKAAVAAITDPDSEARPGYCQRFVRQVVQSVVGDCFDRLWAESARMTAERCRASGYAVHGPPEPGDLLYKTRGSGGHGHVGIFVGNDRVAENSSTKLGRVQGAKGFRSLKQFGPVEVLVRLPVGQEWAVLLPDGQSLDGVEQGGSVHLQARAWARALGLGYEQAQRRARVGGRVVAGRGWLRAGELWLPVRGLAGSAGLAVEVSAGSVRVRRPVAA